MVEAAAQTGSETETAEPIPYSEEKTLLPELAELFGQNGDLVSWISIADTNINYPVMQSVNEPNFYLKHGFDKEYSEYGCPYVQEDCDVQKPSDNLVIYGHHMKNGSMFAHLDKFKSESFWSEHKTIAFNTLTDRQKYEIVAVFRTVVYTDSPDTFKYYRFVDAGNANEFDSFIAKCKELSFYDTGVTAAYGDKLITLSTCEYLAELLEDKNNSLWAAVLYGIHYSDDQIVTVALSQVGNVGGEPYWSWYGFGSRVEWCACFVSWCANECGYIETGVIPKFAGCVNGVQWFKDRGQWIDGSAEPVSGMIIFFDWDNKGSSGPQDGQSDHVGIVQKVENGIVYTVEGNSGDSCRVNQYSVGHYEVLGYGVPQY